MKNYPLLRQILLTGLVAGTLDITAAIVLLAKFNAVGTLKYIASGVFGQAAFSGGAEMAAAGALFHYFIATSFAAAYFLVYPKLTLLQRNKWVSGVLYGAIVWSVMNLVVVPLSLVATRPIALESAAKNMVILMVCIGMPIAWLAERYYRGKL